VPLAQMFGYVTDLRSMTQGRATSSMEFSHYAEVPANVAAELVANGDASAPAVAGAVPPPSRKNAAAPSATAARDAHTTARPSRGVMGIVNLGGRRAMRRTNGVLSETRRPGTRRRASEAGGAL